MKVCTKCKIEKEFVEFSKDMSRKDKYSIICKFCKKIYRKKYPDYVKKYNKKYHLENKEKMNDKSRQYHKNNLDYIKEYNINYYLKNKEYNIKNRDKDKINKRNKERRINEPLFRLKSNIRTLIRNSIRKNGYTKTSKTFEILGCTFEEFKVHLESQFTEGMDWDNAGSWHLDHIYPVSRAIDEEEIIKLNHYTNFQPLWAVDNIKKGNKLINKIK